MKFLPSQFAYLMMEREARRNLRALGKYLAFVASLILLFTLLFHWIMWEVEGVRHSWLTGLYWTLTVMTTLGFGDITFQTDLGRVFKSKGTSVHIVEKDASLRPQLEAVADQVFIGDAADRTVLERAGLLEAPSVLLSTNDDATNIYLAVYCRRLNPEVRIVSRITHERNLESIHRAGADLVLSYASLAVESIVALLQRRELVMLGEGVEFFAVPVPPALVGRA